MQVSERIIQMWSGIPFMNKCLLVLTNIVLLFDIIFQNQFLYLINIPTLTIF